MKPPLRKNTIMKKLVISMTVVMVLQALFFTVSILWGGTVERLDSNAMEILEERASGCRNYLQNDMLHRWGVLADDAASIDRQIRRYLNGAPVSSLEVGSYRTAAVLEEVSNDLIYLLRRNSVNDVFLIFSGGKETVPAQGKSVQMAGIHLRDTDPSSSPPQNSDILFERGSPALTKVVGLAMDTNWEPVFTLDAEDEYFYRPFEAALENPDLSAEDLGYWSSSFRLNDESSAPVLTYSIPLRDETGKPYAVLGVGVLDSWLRRQMESDELAEDRKGVYLLALQEDESSYRTLFSSGPFYSRLFSEDGRFHTEGEPAVENCWRAETGKQIDGGLVMSLQSLPLYNTNTPFSGERWVLAAGVEGDSLFAFSRNMQLRLILFGAISVAFGVICLLLTGRIVTRPIAQLARTVRQSDPQGPVTLEKINIAEIDELSSAIEHLSRRVADASSRLSKIVSLSGLLMGAFEYVKETETVYCTEGFFRLLDPDSREADTCLSESDFSERMNTAFGGLDTIPEGEGTTVYPVGDRDGGRRWIRMKVVENERTVLGVMIDATQEIQERIKIEYERDYDPLTNLLNRRSFQRLARKRIEEAQEGEVSCLLMMDLDNLKHVNDTYGHDCGDQYIRRAAEVLRHFSEKGALAARVSGDEFYLFLTGYSSRKEAEALLNEFREELSKATLLLPGGDPFRLRASAGVAWYPEDSTDFDELVKLADFAMYEVKHSEKGAVRNFDRESFLRDSILLHGREELNRIIDSELVDYAFQPIVEAATGKVYGYEALMRPRSVLLRSPADVLRLARAQSKLYEIERLTWFRAMHSFFSFPETEKRELRVFINSISSQQLTMEDLVEFDREFAGKQRFIVIELTEEERHCPEFTRHKQLRCREFGARIALDDYGAGYNGDAVLLTMTPDFVKLDITFVRDVDKEPSRLRMLQNLVAYLKERGILTIAEGVETKEEMEVLAKNGVDFFQGYFFGRPSFALCPPDPAAIEALRQARRELEAGADCSGPSK